MPGYRDRVDILSAQVVGGLRDWSLPPVVVASDVPATVQPVMPTGPAVAEEAVPDRWRMWAQPSAPLTSTSRVRWDGAVYAVDGLVQRWKSGRRVRHLACQLALDPAAADALATDLMTVTIAWRHRGGTEGAFDPATLTRPVTPHPPYATGPAQVRPAADSQALIGDDVQAVMEYRVAVPVTDPPTGYQPGDIGTVTAADNPGDSALVGTSLVIVALEHESPGYRLVLRCREVQG